MAHEQVSFTGTTEAGPSLAEEAAALDKAAAEAAANASPNADRPDWLPEQFKTIEDFTKSYTDGRGEITRLQQELAALKKGEQKPAETPAPTDGKLTIDEPKPGEGEGKPKEGEENKDGDKPKTPEELANSTPDEQQTAAQKAVESAGLDTTPFAEEFATTGDVSEESRAKIAEALKGQFGDGARALVDQFIAGQKATADNFRSSALAEAGGAEQYQEMATWAKANMKPAELTVYNKAVDSGDINAALLAIRGLKQTYEAANGRAANLVTGDNSIANSAAVVPFASATQMTDAINDPRYAKDEAYRNSIIQRMQISNF